MFDFQHDKVIGINERLTSGERIQMGIIACWGRPNVAAQDQPKDFPPLPAEVACLTLSLLQLPDVR